MLPGASNGVHAGPVRKYLVSSAPADGIVVLLFFGMNSYSSILTAFALSFIGDHNDVVFCVAAVEYEGIEYEAPTWFDEVPRDR